MAKKKVTDGSLALEEKKYQVITIEATEIPQAIKLRVAAYARVSSSSDDQLNSFAAQNKYYTSLISSKENWKMVDIYADEGITGTSVEKRDDFKRMMADCRRGLIDRVLVKSISRFARNTKECLEAIRELKALGVSISFEKENIDTAKMTGEMMTAMYAAFAQAESESISGNMRWSYQKRMQSGQFITCHAPFGYNLEKGKLVVDEDEAKVVRWIFKLYLSGFSITDIGKMVTLTGTPTKDGTPYWHHTAIAYVLQNEKYIGDALVQKTYASDTLPVKKIINNGEKDQYYIKDSHSAIVDKDTFYRVQELYKKKGNRISRAPRQQFHFSMKLECGDCGTVFGRKVCGGITYWVCRKHNKSMGGCSMPQISEKGIEDAFCKMYFKLKTNTQYILGEMLSDLQIVRNRRFLWSQDVIALNKKISELSSQNQFLASLKMQGLVDPDIFIAKSNALTEQIRAAKLEKERLIDIEKDETIKHTKELMEVLENGPVFLADFDEDLFGELVDKVIVESNERIRFRLNNGLELTETVERMMR